MDTQSFKPSKESVIWNMIGSVIAAASSFVLLLIVTRELGTADGGVFALAYSTAQILLSIGKYGVRSYQSTDIKNEISFASYLITRIWFCVAMLILCLGFCLISRYNLWKILIFLFVCVIKMVDAIEDVFHGQLQCSDHLEVAGKLLAARNMGTMLLFCGVIVCNKDLFVACLVTAVCSLVFGLFLNLNVTNRYIPVTLSYMHSECMYILSACFPLFAGSFLSLYIYNACKYALDFYGSEEQIAIYSIIFMPAFVINLFSEFVFKPMLTQIAALWDEKRGREFGQLIGRLLGLICILTVAAGVAGALLGAPILSLVYKVDVITYRLDLVILLISGGFSAAVYLLYNVLTAMRLQKFVILNYGIATALISVLGFLGVKMYAIRGATIAYLFTEILLFLFMLFSILYGYKKGKNE